MSLEAETVSDSNYLPDGIEDKLEDLRDGLGSVDERVREFVRDRPFATLIGALATGYFIGRIIAKH